MTSKQISTTTAATVMGALVYGGLPVWTAGLLTVAVMVALACAAAALFAGRR